jgi:septal ring factor EnvC (AmiA/AmiB activator)
VIAEEVAEVSAELITRDEDGKPQTVRYEAVNAMLLNEFLKEHKQLEIQTRKVDDQETRIAHQEATIAQQQKEIQTLMATVKEQAAQIQKVCARVEAGNAVFQTAFNDR